MEPPYLIKFRRLQLLFIKELEERIKNTTFTFCAVRPIIKYKFQKKLNKKSYLFSQTHVKLSFDRQTII